MTRRRTPKAPEDSEKKFLVLGHTPDRLSVLALLHTDEEAHDEARRMLAGWDFTEVTIVPMPFGPSDDARCRMANVKTRTLGEKRAEVEEDKIKRAERCERIKNGEGTLQDHAAELVDALESQNLLSAVRSFDPRKFDGIKQSLPDA